MNKKLFAHRVLTSRTFLNIMYLLHLRCIIEYAVVLELADRHV